MDNEFLGGMLILFIIFYVVMILLSLAVAVLCINAQWRLFEKAGEHGWASLIPIYNYFVMTKIATGNYLLGWIYMVICVVYTIFQLYQALCWDFPETVKQLALHIL